MTDKTKTTLELFKEKLLAKKAAKQKILDERYEDVTEYLETEEARTERLMNTDSAWQQ